MNRTGTTFSPERKLRKSNRRPQKTVCHSRVASKVLGMREASKKKRKFWGSFDLRKEKSKISTKKKPSNIKLSVPNRDLL